MKRVIALLFTLSLAMSITACETGTDAVDGENVYRTQRNGFDSATNETYEFAGYSVEIPEYWKSESDISDGIQRYAETGSKVAMLQITAQAETDDSYPVTFDGLMADNENMLAVLEMTAFHEITEYEVIDTGVIKGILYKGELKLDRLGVSGYGEWFTFASEEDRSWCTLVVGQTDNTDHLYTDDFMKMIQSIKPNDPESDNQSSADSSSEAESTQITLTMGANDFKGMQLAEAERHFLEMGFVEFEYQTVDTENETADGTICYVEITEWLWGDSDFAKGDMFDIDSTVTFFSYEYEEPAAPSPVFYSTNDYDTAKNGNTGVFSYSSRNGGYDIYWIIDFDEGYVYYFTDGSGDDFCDRLEIDYGTLNDAISVTYHVGGDTWSYKLHFKYVNHPETLIMVDQNGTDWEYTTTDLSDALELKDALKVTDY